MSALDVADEVGGREREAEPARPAHQRAGRRFLRARSGAVVDRPYQLLGRPDLTQEPRLVGVAWALAAVRAKRRLESALDLGDPDRVSRTLGLPGLVAANR